MTIANLKPEDRDQYDARFQAFLARVVEIAGYNPRRKYLYPMMQGVPFRDLEVTLEILAAEYARAQANDNTAL